MGMKWVQVGFLISIHLFVFVTADYCQYKTSTGQVKNRNCRGKCCSPYDNGHDVCCSYSYPYGPLVGAGIGTVVILAIVALCILYLCCKRKITDSYRRARDSSSSRTRVRRASRGIVPSVSISVEPTLPPPYDCLPPPPYYCNEIEMGENSNQTKDENKKYPDHPPPEYTPFSEVGK